MTRNQIEYANYLESNRHNMAQESETARNDRAVERETKRANRAREKENTRSNKAREKENTRSNKAREKLTRYSNKTERLGQKESVRHNKATELNANQTLSELNRHNLATESATNQQNAETQRHNLANESLSGAQINASIMQAQIAADAQKTAATINANASKYNTDMQMEIAKWKESNANWRTKDTNATNEQINEATNLSKERIASADRLQDAIRTSDENAIKREANNIQKQKNELEAKYKNKEITLEYFKFASNQLSKMAGWLSKAGVLLKFLK